MDEEHWRISPEVMKIALEIAEKTVRKTNSTDWRIDVEEITNTTIHVYQALMSGTTVTQESLKKKKS